MKKVFEINEIKDMSYEKNHKKEINSDEPKKSTLNNAKKDKNPKKSMSDEFILGEDFVRSDDPRYFG